MKYILNIRPEYNERKARIEDIDGTEVDLVYAWHMGDDDPYPGEDALVPSSGTATEGLFRALNMSWIASGDVEEV